MSWRLCNVARAVLLFRDVFRGLIIAMCFALGVAPAWGQARSERAAAATATTAAAHRQYMGARSSVRTLDGRRAGMNAKYRIALEKVDRIKRGRRSWRSERKLRRTIADTQAQAKQLAIVERQLAAARKRMVRAQRRLERAVQSERAMSPAPPRTVALGKLSALTGRAQRKRIVVPSLRIDPLADAADLRDQATLIGESERRLARELKVLEARVRKYERMAKLSRKSRRAKQLAALDDNRPRRGTVRATGRNSASAAEADEGAGSSGGQSVPAPESPDDGASPSPSDPNSDFGGDAAFPTAAADLAYVLSDVVDRPALAWFARAERSGTARERARAAAAVRLQVKKSLERLRKQRAEIERRRRNAR